MRDSDSVPTNNFYVAFREWTNINFPILNDEVWSDLLDEDESISYSEVGNGRIHEELVIEDGETELPQGNNSSTE